MKFVGDTLSFSEVDEDGASHTIFIPFYHRAAVGVFPGTQLFAVPLRSTNEIVLTPIDPETWGDLWRLEATVSDTPGSAKSLVETLVANDVNVLVHEGVSESAEKGETVHQIFEILDLAKYKNDIDGLTEERNHIQKALLKPNRLVNELVSSSATCLKQTREYDGWEMRFRRMDFFFRNKNDRGDVVPLSLNVDKKVRIPKKTLRELKFAGDAKRPLPVHMISDTEQKYIKLRILDPKRYYLLLAIEHLEQVGAIDEFMGVFREYDLNMIDSYSRLKSIATSALFYALTEFSDENDATADTVTDVVTRLSDSSPTLSVQLKGAVGPGPALASLTLPAKATVATKAARVSADEMGVGDTDADSARSAVSGRGALGAPYFLDRHDSDKWQLQTAQVFMAVPFADDYKDFYTEVIAPAVEDVGLEPVRVDQMPIQAKRRPVVERIEEAIARSRFVIADLTGWNPNVIYEVGLAVGISKPILLLCPSTEFDDRKIPFDFQSYPMLKYSAYRVGDLKEQLTKRAKELQEDTEAFLPEKEN